MSANRERRHCTAPRLKKENRFYRHAKRSARVYRTEARSPRCLIRVGRPRSDGLCRDRNNVRKRGGQVGMHNRFTLLGD